MTDRKNIKLPAPLFEQLKADKPDHMNWPTYFREECLGDDGTDVTAIEEQLATIEDRLTTLERTLEDHARR